MQARPLIAEVSPGHQTAEPPGLAHQQPQSAAAQRLCPQTFTLMHIVVGIPEGHIVRNLLENGLLPALRRRGAKVTLVSPASRITSFRERWAGEGVDFAPMHPFEPPAKAGRIAALRRRCARRGLKPLADSLLRWERALLSRRSEDLYGQLLSKDCSLVLASHVHLPVEAPLIYGAMAHGIPTLGILNSWDNVYKGVACHPDHIVTWNNLNKQELVEFEGYEPESVTPVGAPAFDPYFEPRDQWTREEFCGRLQLDPQRPILAYATVGQFVRFFEETNLLDLLLEGAASGAIEGDPQIVARLHPWSRPEMFEKYRHRSNVRLTRYDNYVPTLEWCPTREESVLAGNLLRHADVCLTPGSTMALEACIFDTPVIVPVFNTYQPEVWAEYYRNYCLALHFGRLVNEKILPVAQTQDELFEWINRFLRNPELQRENRRRIVNEYIQFTDGGSVDRIANFAVSIAGASAARPLWTPDPREAPVR